MIGCEHGILEEERRLCYVGFTRAKKILRVTWCQQRQDTFARGPTSRYKPSLPSRDLLEAGLISREDYDSALTEAAPALRRKELRRTRRRRRSARPMRGER